MLANRQVLFIYWLPLILMTFWILPGMAFCEDNPSERAFYQQQKALEADWEAMQNQSRQAWSNMQKQAEQNWASFLHSTQKEWVDYDLAMDTRSRVDFEKGKIEIETVFPDDSTATIEKAAQKIISRTKTILARTYTADQTILKNQIADTHGQIVTDQNADAFLSGELLARITKDPSPYITQDGSRKTRYSVSIDMVPKHIDIRAKQFLPLVASNATRFNLDPKLIMAIIHTESFFNPLAISTAGAVGLMQIIPSMPVARLTAFCMGRTGRSNRITSIHQESISNWAAPTCTC